MHFKELFFIYRLNVADENFTNYFTFNIPALQ